VRQQKLKLKLKLKLKVMANYKNPKSPTKQELPDAKKHQQISFIKSAIRLGACFWIPWNV
tara:strand:- start:419 stop:598 length:180 start_codon:yes stop_codon:yes gene_type:complete